MTNTRLNIASFFGFIIISLATCCCTHSTGPWDDDIQKIGQGYSLTAKIGHYVYIDFSKYCTSPGVIQYRWTVDEGNPGYTFVEKTNPIQSILPVKTGLYKFYVETSSSEGAHTRDSLFIRVTENDNLFFEDPVFELVIRLVLGNPDQDIANDDLLSIKIVRPSGLLVTSIKGIEKCKNIEVLGLSLQRESDISMIKALTKLREIRLDQNPNISDISVLSSLPLLEKINIGETGVTDVSALRPLLHLTYLNIMSIPSPDISILENMTDLRELWMYRSTVPDFSVVARLRKLELLWLAHCNLTTIPFVADHKNLLLLHIGTNQITDISGLSGCTNLELLYADANQIADISVLQYLQEISVLELDDNKITNILPLVNNNGISEGDVINLNRNPLDSISVNTYIPMLRKRGVSILQ